MKLRLKFFLILIAFSLIPLLAIGLISNHLAWKIGGGQLLCLDQLTREQFLYIGLIAVVVMAAAALVAFTSVRAGTRSITELVDAWRRLAAGDFSVKVSPRFRDERDILHNAFNEAVCRFEEHFKMSTALGLAEEVQKNLLPGSTPRHPVFDLAAASTYCERTGGDYYDILDLDPENHDRLAVVVGDVSGHGVSSALLMATGRAHLRQRASLPGGPARIITDVNRHLSRDTRHTGQFMTLFYAEFDSVAGSVRWTRAGHDPAEVYDPARDEFIELMGRGPALGLQESTVYEEYEHFLTPGAVVVVGTDGIWETRNPDGEMFGKERLREVIRRNGARPAEDLLDAVTDALERFRRGLPFEDDVTLAVVRYKGKRDGMAGAGE